MNTEINLYLLERAEMMIKYEKNIKKLMCNINDAVILIWRRFFHSKILTLRELFDNLKNSHYMMKNKRYKIICNSINSSQLNNLF